MWLYFVGTFLRAKLVERFLIIGLLGLAGVLSNEPECCCRLQGTEKVFRTQWPGKPCKGLLQNHDCVDYINGQCQWNSLSERSQRSEYDQIDTHLKEIITHLTKLEETCGREHTMCGNGPASIQASIEATTSTAPASTCPASAQEGTCQRGEHIGEVCHCDEDCRSHQLIPISAKWSGVDTRCLYHIPKGDGIIIALDGNVNEPQFEDANGCLILTVESDHDIQGKITRNIYTREQSAQCHLTKHRDEFKELFPELKHLNCDVTSVIGNGKLENNDTTCTITYTCEPYASHTNECSDKILHHRCVGGVNKGHVCTDDDDCDSGNLYRIVVPFTDGVCEFGRIAATCPLVTTSIQVKNHQCKAALECTGDVTEVRANPVTSLFYPSGTQNFSLINVGDGTITTTNMCGSTPCYKTTCNIHGITNLPDSTTHKTGYTFFHGDQFQAQVYEPLLNDGGVIDPTIVSVGTTFIIWTNAPTSYWNGCEITDYDYITGDSRCDHTRDRFKHY